jgi:uncharacterized protein YkwD
MLLCGALYGQSDEEKILPFTDTYLILTDTKQILEDLNRERAKRGLRKLTYIPRHQTSLDSWASHMAKKGLYHAGDNEVISTSPLYLEEIIPGFMASKGHKKILMQRGVKGVCIGVCQTPMINKTKKTHNGEQTLYTPGILYTVIRVYYYD